MKLWSNGLLLAAALLTPALAGAQTLDRITETKVIRLGVREDAAPFSWRTEAGGIAGYSVDLCVAVAESLKRELALEDLQGELVVVTAKDRFEAVAEGRIDLLCEATSATLSRRETVDFSISTYIDGAGVLLGKDAPGSFEEMGGHSIGVLQGTTTEEALKQSLEHYGVAAELVALPTHDAGLEQLKSGAIDAYFADRTILQFMILGDPEAAGLRLADRYFTFEPYALALPLGDGDFRLAVDRALSRLYRSKEIEKIFTKTFSKDAKPSEALQYLFLVSGLPE